MKTCQTCNQNKAEWYALEPAEEFECRACFIKRTLWSQVIKNPNALDPALDPDPNTAARYSENDMRALRERLARIETAAQKLLDDADCGGYGSNLSLIYNSNVDALRDALEA